MNGSRGRVFSVPALPMAVAYDGAPAQKFFSSPAGCPLMKPFFPMAESAYPTLEHVVDFPLPPLLFAKQIVFVFPILTPNAEFPVFQPDRYRLFCKVNTLPFVYYSHESISVSTINLYISATFPTKCNMSFSDFPTKANPSFAASPTEATLFWYMRSHSFSASVRKKA